MNGDTTTIPGAKTNSPFSKPEHSQMYAWINYGGITRPVQLIIRPDAFIQHFQVIAEPGQAKGNARIRIKTSIKNLSEKNVQVPVSANIYFDGKPCNIRFKPLTASLQQNSEGAVVLEGVFAGCCRKILAAR